MNNQPMPHLYLKSLRTRFSLHFLKALKKINQNQPLRNSNNNSGDNNLMVAKRYKKVKLAANSSLASAVGPRRAWTRALLLRARCCPRRHALGKRRIARRMTERDVHSRPAEGGERAEELRRLVPGGEAMDTQSLLDETLHYVMCLTAQVNVMRSIVDFCSTSS